MGSKSSRTENDYAATVPLSSSCSAARLTLSTSSAATGTLPVGRYDVALYTTGAVAYAKFAATVALPTSAQAPTSEVFALRDGAVLEVKVAGTLAVILTGSGTTGELALTKID